jgi:penicillin amidase
VAGVTFPGAPVVLIGHNGKLAWGVTNVGYDVTDYFVEVLNAQGEVLHPAPGEPPFKPVVTVTEQFGIRTSPGGVIVLQPVDIRVVPWHGPVLPGSRAPGDSFELSVQWTGQNPTQEVLAFWQLNSATTVDDAFQALNWFEVGAQNFVLADTAGNIGYYPHAWVPIRPAGCIPWAPMPGDGSCDWTGRIADFDLPQARNPAAGWLATANNDITGSTVDNDPLTSPPPYPPDQYLYYINDLGYRHARIAQRLTEKAGGYTLDDMTAIQSDVHSLFAEALVPALLAWWSSFDCVFTDVDGSGECAAALSDLGLTPAADLLAAWAAAGPQQFQTPTGLATSNPAGAATADASERQAAAASMLFHALVPRLARLILDDDLGSHGYSVSSWFDSQVVAKYLVALGGYARGSPPAVPLLTEALGASLCIGPSGDETCADMAVLALQEAVAFLSAQPEFGSSANPQDWLWGRLHRAFFRSNLSPTTTLLDYGPFANDGGLHTVDVANFSWSNDGPGGFTQGSGANVRFAAEVGSSSIRWRAVIPGGQSGFAGDANYMDQIPAYLANQPGDQPYARSEVEAAASRSLVFTP